MFIGSTPLKYEDLYMAEGIWTEDLDADGEKLLDSFHIPRTHIRRAYYTMYLPKGFLLPHIDEGYPFTQRWQIPIEPAGTIWDEQDGIQTSPSEPYQMKHWMPHAVWNDTNKVRKHILIDTTIEITNVPYNYNLRKTEIPDEIKKYFPEKVFN